MINSEFRTEAWNIYLREMKIESAAWSLCGIVSIIVWIIIKMQRGTHYFWPFWVIVPWGTVLGGRVIDASLHPF